MVANSNTLQILNVVQFLKKGGALGMLNTLPGSVTWGDISESGYFVLTDLKGLVSADTAQTPLEQDLAFLRNVREYKAYLAIGNCSEDGVRTGLLVTNGRVYRVVHDAKKNASAHWPDVFSLIYKEG